MKFRLVLFFCLVFYFAGAQTQFSGWLGNFSTFKLSNKFSIHFDGQLRSTDNIEHLSSLLLRTGLNVHVRKNMIATAGYAFAHSRRVIASVSGYFPEHRFWEQFLIHHPFLHTTLNHRLRLEQRFISKSVVENNALKNEGNVYSNRVRYFFRTMIPLGKKLQPNTFFAGIQDEVFFNFGDKSGVNGETFDQNRIFLSFGYRLSARTDLEIGYLNQYINGRGDAFVNNHIVQFGVYLRL
jgi:hypothetical protein